MKKMSFPSLLGVRFDPINKEDTINSIRQAIDTGTDIYHRGDINVGTIVMAQNDAAFRLTINKANLINVDGMGAKLGARFLGISTPPRITGVDLFVDLLDLAERHDYSVYFLGATDEVLFSMMKRLRISHPNLRISGFNNGYFWDKEAEIVEKINQVCPTMVFVGIKSPEKEFFIEQYKEKLSSKFIMGVGGTFDVISGKVKRAPPWMQNCGLEWLYRVIQEPRRMWKRYLFTNSQFAWLLLIEKFKQISGRT